MWGLGVGCNAVACALLVWRRRVPLVVAPLAGWASAVASLIEPELSEPAAGIAMRRGRLLLVRALPG